MTQGNTVLGENTATTVATTTVATTTVVNNARGEPYTRRLTGQGQFSTWDPLDLAPNTGALLLSPRHTERLRLQGEAPVVNRNTKVLFTTGTPYDIFGDPIGWASTTYQKLRESQRQAFPGDTVVVATHDQVFHQELRTVAFPGPTTYAVIPNSLLSPTTAYRDLEQYVERT